jgi:protein-S-isoprenylcysteine O-methyltransferase Ste14
MRPLAAIGSVWLLWVVSWMLAAMWVNRTIAKPPSGDELHSRLTVAAGAALLFWRFHDSQGYTGPGGWILFSVVVMGILFAWWARLHLGRLWSGRVTRKEGHRVVNTGPYALVRHPIYTGVILSAFATAIAERQLLALLGAAVIAAGILAAVTLGRALSQNRTRGCV